MFTQVRICKCNTFGLLLFEKLSSCEILTSTADIINLKHIVKTLPAIQISYSI